ncbi:hypothetical protein GCM10023195_04130 [Actinoallomurus liliacearum]|uniref:MmyB-like transcription regulator ligand binding domain-containing protein n=1 Tax=Actinoallomurus liliacearum TaxID=1080073 RepID=A0ABP8TBU0_9ACTN
MNRLRALFTDPVAQEYHPDWDENAAGVVAQLRAEVDADSDDARLRALVGELSRTSERFRTLWARHDVRRGTSGTGLIRHPRVGDLRLRREKLAVTGTDGLLLVIYHADPGTPSAEALALLASLVRTGSPGTAEPDRR